MIKSQKPYDDKQAFRLKPRAKHAARKVLEKQAATLGLTLQTALA